MEPSVCLNEMSDCTPTLSLPVGIIAHEIQLSNSVGDDTKAMERLPSVSCVLWREEPIVGKSLRHWKSSLLLNLWVAQLRGTMHGHACV